MTRKLKPQKNSHTFWKYPRDRDQKHPDHFIKGYYDSQLNQEDNFKSNLRQKINSKIGGKVDQSDKLELRIRNLHLENKHFKTAGPIDCLKKLRGALRRLRSTGISNKLFETVLSKLEIKDTTLIKFMDKIIANTKDVKTSYINWSKVMNYVKEIEEVMDVEDWMVKIKRRQKYEN